MSGDDISRGIIWLGIFDLICATFLSPDTLHWYFFVLSVGLEFSLVYPELPRLLLFFFTTCLGCFAGCPCFSVSLFQTAFSCFFVLFLILVNRL